MAKQTKKPGKEQVNVGTVLRRRLWLLLFLTFLPAAATYFLTFAFLGQWLPSNGLGFLGAILLVSPGFAGQLLLKLTWREVSTGWFNFLVVTVLGASVALKRMDIGFFLTAVLLLSAVYLLVVAGVALSKFIPVLDRNRRGNSKDLVKPKAKRD